MSVKWLQMTPSPFATHEGGNEVWRFHANITSNPKPCGSRYEKTSAIAIRVIVVVLLVWINDHACFVPACVQWTFESELRPRRIREPWPVSLITNRSTYASRAKNDTRTTPGKRLAMFSTSLGLPNYKFHPPVHIICSYYVENILKTSTKNDPTKLSIIAKFDSQFPKSWPTRVNVVPEFRPFWHWKLTFPAST